MRRSRVWLLVVLLAAIGISSCAGGAGGMAVQEAWARPGAAGGNSAIYFVIDNRQGQADTLLSAASDAANMVELHISKMSQDGTMIMEHQENVPVPAGKKVEFKPGGLHVMLMGLTGDLKPGDKITVTLTFEKAGSMDVEAAVREP